MLLAESGASNKKKLSRGFKRSVLTGFEEIDVLHKASQHVHTLEHFMLPVRASAVQCG